MLSNGDIERLIAEKRCEIEKEKIVLGLSAVSDACQLQDIENQNGGTKARRVKAVRIAEDRVNSEDVAKKEQEEKTEIPADLERYIRRYIGLPVMLKAGEFSPNNPLVRAAERGVGGDVLLGLGEYERRRNTLRKIQQQQYREYLDQQAKKKQEAKEQAEKECREREEKERQREEERERARQLIENQNIEAEKRRCRLLDENIERERVRQQDVEESRYRREQNVEEKRASVCYVPAVSSNTNVTSSYRNKVDTGVQVGVSKPLSVGVQTDHADLYRLSPSPTKFQLTQAERELSPRTVEDLNKPTYHHDKPAYHNDKPAYNNDKPAYNNDKPTYNSDKPTYHDDRPINNQNRNSYDNYKHSYLDDKPVCNTDKVSYHDDRPINNQNRSSYDNNKPTYPDDKPVCNTDKVSYHDDRPINNQNRSSYDNYKPTYPDDKPVCNNDKLSYHDDRPINNQNRNSYDNYKHSYLDDKPICNNDNVSYHDDRPINNQNRNSYDNYKHLDDKPICNTDKVSYHDDRPINNQNRNSYDNYKHSYLDDKPICNNDKVSYHDDRPINNQNRSSYDYKTTYQDDRPIKGHNRAKYDDDRPIQPAAWAGDEWREEKEQKSARRRSYGDFDERSSSIMKTSRERLISDLRHTYMPSILDADAILLRNQQAEKEAQERRQFYQQELKNQIQEQQRIRAERQTREKMLEAAEMRRLEEQLKMLRAAQDSEQHALRGIQHKIKNSAKDFERKRTTLQKEIDNEHQKLLRATTQPHRKPHTSHSETNLKLPTFSNREKRLPFSTNISDTSIFNPNYDVDSYLRKNLNPKKETLMSNFDIQRNIVVEKALVHDMPKERSREKPKYEPTFLKNVDEIQDETPIPILRHSPKTTSSTNIEENTSDGMKLVEDKWKVPAVQKNILKNLPKEDGKNISILTQLGSIRRQLQLEQLRLDNLMSKSNYN